MPLGLAALAKIDNHPMVEAFRLIHALASVPGNTQLLRAAGAVKVVREAMDALKGKSWVESETREWGVRALAALPT